MLFGKLDAEGAEGADDLPHRSGWVATLPRKLAMFGVIAGHASPDAMRSSPHGWVEQGKPLNRRCRRSLRRHIALAALAVPLAALGAPPAAWAGSGEPDTQLWTEANVTGPLASNITITGVARLRLSESEPNPT